MSALMPGTMSRSAHRRRLMIFLTALSFILMLSPKHEARADVDADGGGCKRAGKHCRWDAQCCGTLICNEAQTCSSGCRINGRSYASGQQDPGNPCEVCAPDQSTTAWSMVPDGTACHTGDPGTPAGACSSGVCTQQDLCANVTCAASDQCHAAGVCNPSTGTCSNPPKADGTACDDAQPCTTNDACQAGTCTGSPAATCGISNILNDSLFLRLTSSDGSLIEQYGTRNDDGTAKSLESIRISTGSSESNIYVDSTGRPVRIIAANGVSLGLEWLNGAVALTVVSPDGSLRFNTAVAFPPAAPPKTVSDGLLEHASARSRAGTSSTLVVRFPEPVGVGEGNSARTSSSFHIPGIQGTVPASVYLSQCDTGVTGQDVVVDVIDTASPINPFIGSYPAAETGEGSYVAQIPSGLTDIDPKAICESVATVVSAPCDFIEASPGGMEYICSSLAAALESSGEGAILAGPAEAACLALAEGLELSCKTLGASPVIGAPDIGEQVCDMPILEQKIPGTISLVAKAYTLPPSSSGSVSAPSSGPFPELTIDLGSDSVIRSFTLDPPNPAAGEGYVATADVFCLPAGTSVSLGIVGTDGYTDQVDYFVSQTAGNGTFTLYVPGGASGVRDVVTVTVQRPDGTVVTSTASLVFG